MTQAARPRTRLMVVGLVSVAALGVLAASGLQDSLVYYRTPSEIAARAQTTTQRVRLGGLVQPGSVREDAGSVRFVLTDGAADVVVLHRGDPPGVFQEGQGALVEGTFDDRRRFRSDLLVVRHSNEYRGADGETYRPPDGEMGAAGP
ncbi:MAG: cytochrome c maturation protein CcmE [Actinomycetota bacterium]|nr:cytochrome c maturation protein CcmE [Actinomycetota bacterium]